MKEDTKIQCEYQFNGIKFRPTKMGNLAVAGGNLQVHGQNSPFGLVLAPKLGGGWLLKEVYTVASLKDFFNTREVLQLIVSQATKLLEPVNVWASESPQPECARINLNTNLIPPKVADKVFISFRPNMLSLPISNWEHLWEMIEGRVQADNCFIVQGFSKNDITLALEELKLLFHSDWVRARYQTTNNQNDIPKMAADLSPNSKYWFPSYHLARTALGSMCIDPGWNYLVDIGLSVRELSSFRELGKLKSQLMQSPGTQHHLCLAAELFRRGYLIALEPMTGSGNYTNDLLVKIDETGYHIEVKEFSSTNPGKRLREQIRKKTKALPNVPGGPVIFHAVLVENGFFDQSKEDKFFREVHSLKDELPPKISAVVAGRRFVDSRGGRVKRDLKACVLNPVALVPSQEQDLIKLFSQNYHEIENPIFGIGSFINTERNGQGTGFTFTLQNSSHSSYKNVI